MSPWLDDGLGGRLWVSRYRFLKFVAECLIEQERDVVGKAFSNK